MGGKRRSARIVTVKARCGHDVLVELPPGELGPVGRERITEAASRPCYKCRHSKKNPLAGDARFVREVLLPWSGIRRVAFSWSNSKNKWPDIWVRDGDIPVITVTKEWQRQRTHERRKRLVHEFLHLMGYDHGVYGGLEYSTYPERDEFSKMVYRQLVSSGNSHRRTV